MHENSDNEFLFNSDSSDPELGEEYADWLDEIHEMDVAEDLNSCYIDPNDLDDIPF